MTNHDFPPEQEEAKLSPTACSDSVIAKDVEESGKVDRTSISEEDMMELAVSTTLEEKASVLVPTTVISQSTKKISLYRQLRTYIEQLLLFILALLPDDVIYTAIVVWSLLRWAWRHKFVSFIMAVAGAVAIGHFQIKKIQTKNRTIPEKSVLDIQWYRLTNNPHDMGNNFAMDIARQILPFIPAPQAGGISANEVIEAIYYAAEDKRIVGLTCDFTMNPDPSLTLGPWTDSNSMNMDVIQEFRKAVETFIKSKPPNTKVIAFASTMCQNCYYAATAFKKIYMQPFGEISLHGRRLQRFYYRKLLDHLNITTISDKSSEAKDLFDKYTAYEMNAESQYANWELLNNLDQQFWNDILTSRKHKLLNKANITVVEERKICNMTWPTLSNLDSNLPEFSGDCVPHNWKVVLMHRLKTIAKFGVMYDDDAIQHGLIDRLSYPRQILSEFKSYGKTLSINAYARRMHEGEGNDHKAVLPTNSKKIEKQAQELKIRRALVHKSASSAESTQASTILTNSSSAASIHNSSSMYISKIDINTGLEEGPTLRSWIRDIEKAVDNDNVGAIIIRINCPGGIFMASDSLAEAILYAKSKKPVVASFGSMATSGGYYIAVVTDRIIANPASLTGSIGVTGYRYDLSKFLEIIGVNFFSMSTTGVSTSVFKSASEEQLEASAARNQYLYKKFVQHVSKHRNISEWQLTNFLAKGNLFTGEQALYRGLVDELGGLHEAKAVACKLAAQSRSNGLPAPKCEWLTEQKTSFRKVISSAISDQIKAM